MPYDVELPDMPVTPYAEVRPQIQSGDVRSNRETRMQPEWPDDGSAEEVERDSWQDQREHRRV